MVDVLKETVLSLTEASKKCPVGHRPHVASLWRWCRRGCRGVTLEHAFIGGKIVVSEESLQRFFARLSIVPPPSFSPVPSTHRRRVQIAKARKVLSCS